MLTRSLLSQRDFGARGLGPGALDCAVVASEKTLNRETQVPRSVLKNPVVWLILFPFIAVPIAVGVVLYLRRGPAPLPIIRDAPRFTLQSHAAKPFSNNQLAGKTWIANFIFTRCEVVCPITTSKMADIQQRLGPASKVQLVSFSVDPQYDTPERLRKYAKRFKANHDNWTFLRGKRRMMKDIVTQGFNIGMAIIGLKDDADVDTTKVAPKDMIHGEHFVLVDKKQRIRGYYKLDDDKTFQTLVEHAERLAKD